MPLTDGGRRSITMEGSTKCMQRHNSRHRSANIIFEIMPLNT
uniref:Uncharacterized protein n=1 Tax=Rhizobium meliloti TaxID=382 RepID=I2E1Z1_RHIML|nr:short hypothetical protein [Sinorhizobium meliloti]